MTDHIPKAFIVHDLDHACAALAAAAECGVAVALHSPLAAAASLGPVWFARLEAAARAGHPQARAVFILDCGAAPGHALAALRHGLRDISLDAQPDLLARLAAMGLRIHPRPIAALDLLEQSDPLAACRFWLKLD